MIDFDTFKSHSKYERKVDFKKLKFIYDALTAYSRASSKSSDALKILEVGCGDGSISLPLSALGASVTSFDIDERLVGTLRKELSDRRINNIALSCDNAYQFSTESRFDVIVASEVLEHVDLPGKLVKKLKEYLTPGGYFIVTVPNGYGPWELKNKLKKIVALKAAKDDECGHTHVQFFTLSRIKELFTENDLTLIAFGKSDSLSGLSYSIATNSVLAPLDTSLADLLPSWMASGWYFVFRNRALDVLTLRQNA